jgi:putative endonuclease
MTYYVYILASQRNGTLYVGVTNDLVRRIFEHRNDMVPGFTRKYGIHRLVWFDSTPDVRTAIAREKQIKKWRRAWKLDLIERSNPDWADLYDGLSEGSDDGRDHLGSGFPRSRE